MKKIEEDKGLSKRGHKQESGARMSISEPNVYTTPSGKAMGLWRESNVKGYEICSCSLADALTSTKCRSKLRLCFIGTVQLFCSGRRMLAAHNA
jgi:hypothetical protein